MDANERKKLLAAIQARDPRYDGRIYFAVTTTGIYCRPICPAKPRPENVRFFRSQSEAESHGFRPCLRCRPDLSPLSPQWRGTAAVVGRALEHIKTSPTDVVSLADRVGLSDRQLRRLFQEHVGASPIQIALSLRLHLARQLLSQSRLKIIDIAFASGFESIRRFNDAFKLTYKKSPRDYRQSQSSRLIDPQEGLALEIPVGLPFDFKEMLSFFERHLIIGVEWVTPTSYERHFQRNGKVGYLKVQYDDENNKIKIHCSVDDSSQLRFVLERVRCLFDLSHNPYEMNLPKWVRAELKNTILNTRIPGAFDPFETAICVILGQLVSVSQAKRVVEKLVTQLGARVANPSHPKIQSLFPTPETLANSHLESLGIPRTKAGAIRELAKKVISKEIDLQGFEDFGTLREKLLSIRGIGPWTAELIALRCLRDPDSWPVTDLIISRAIEFENLNAEDFSGWRAYLTVALWKLHAETLSRQKGVKK